MEQRILKLSCLGAVLLTMSLAVCGQPVASAAFQPAATQTASAKAKTRDTPAATIFVFHIDEFWLNLHHFLYVLGRAQNKERDAAREAVSGAPADQERGLEKLSDKDQKMWREAVAAYAAGVSKKDLVFDAPLPALTNTLARVGGAKSLSPEVDPEIATILTRVAPIYRKAWWQKHHDANSRWQKSIQPLIARHGPTVLAFITKAYQLPWPVTGFPVHVSAYSNWAGAYSTDGDLLVLSSLNPSTQGDYGLETIFHEGMHQWDEQILATLREQAKNANKLVPRNLSHSLIFFTAGEAIRRVLPEHVPYAEKYGVWQRGLGPLKTVLQEVWKPYLDGRGTRDEAFADLIKRTGVEPPQN